MAQGNDSVRIVLFDYSDRTKFLILTEADDKTNWKLPGGKFDTEGETADGAARRELGEELGLGGDQIGLQKVAELLNDDGVSARYIFSGTIKPDTVHPSEEIALTKWVREADIPVGPNKNHIKAALESLI